MARPHATYDVIPSNHGNRLSPILTKISLKNKLAATKDGMS